jgi:acetyl-CoA synthetase
MNLGGIKVSSVEIERVLNRHAAVRETAAVAVPAADVSLPVEEGRSEVLGFDRLVVFVVPHSGAIDDEATLQTELQQLLRVQLNPLFKIAELVIVTELPRTASNKLLRRQLRSGIRRQPPAFG